jgi:hypothetical protein
MFKLEIQNEIVENMLCEYIHKINIEYINKNVFKDKNEKINIIISFLISLYFENKDVNIVINNKNYKFTKIKDFVVNAEIKHALLKLILNINSLKNDCVVTPKTILANQIIFFAKFNIFEDMSKKKIKWCDVVKKSNDLNFNKQMGGSCNFYSHFYYKILLL